MMTGLAHISSFFYEYEFLFAAAVNGATGNKVARLLRLP